MQASNDNTPRLVSLNQVCDMTSLSRTAINNFRLRGDFPAEVNMGDRRIAFVLSEILEWIQARIDKRRLSGSSQMLAARAA